MIRREEENILRRVPGAEIPRRREGGGGNIDRINLRRDTTIAGPRGDGVPTNEQDRMEEGGDQVFRRPQTMGQARHREE